MCRHKNLSSRPTISISFAVYASASLDGPEPWCFLPVRPYVRTSVCPSVCPSVRSSVRPSVCPLYQFCEQDMLQTNESIVLQVGTSWRWGNQGREAVNFGCQKVKGQDHRRPGGGIILDPLGSSRLSSFLWKLWRNSDSVIVLRP